MTLAFHVTGSREAPPRSEHGTIYCDGAGPTSATSGKGSLRPGIDVELSHWVPNQTPERYRADTSTEICLNFSAAPAGGRYDLAVNNHVDVDGVLAMFAILSPDLALRHADSLAGGMRRSRRSRASAR